MYLKYKEKSILPGKLHWLYFDTDKIIINRISEIKKMAKTTSPIDETILTVEIAFSKGDKVDSMEDQELEEVVKNQLLRTGITKDKKYLESSSNRENFVYPVQVTGYNEELSKVKAYVNKYEQMYSIGTGGEFSYADSQILFHKAFDVVNIFVWKRIQKHSSN